MQFGENTVFHILFQLAFVDIIVVAPSTAKVKYHGADFFA